MGTDDFRSSVFFGFRIHSHRRYALRLVELEAPHIEFEEKLWHAMVDRVTVYNDDRLVYSLKDGTEIRLGFDRE